MLIERLPISRINPAPYNPRLDLKPGDSDYERLKTSFGEFGNVEPLVWNQRTGHLVGGHQRLKILIAMGVTETEVVVVDLSPEREKALNLALNKIRGDWDPRKLAELLDELIQLPDIDLEITGFEVPEARALITEMLEPDLDHEEDFDVEGALDRSKPAITQPGDLIELGVHHAQPEQRHRLLCGDCTNPEHVRRVMNGGRAILFATDPPYLVNYDGTNHPASSRRKEQRKNKDWSATYGITWDEEAANPDLYQKFIRVAINEAILPHAAWYCWHASRRQAMLESVWNEAGAFVHQQILWVKDRPILTRSWYGWKHEPCFFGWIKGRKPPRRAEDYPASVWEVPTIPVGQKTEHPTSKPVELFMIPMRQHTRAGEICYEPFCGSGSQVIAAEKLKRRCYALEIDPHYVDVIVRRYIAFAGEHSVTPDVAKRYRRPPASPAPEQSPPASRKRRSAKPTAAPVAVTARTGKGRPTGRGRSDES